MSNQETRFLALFVEGREVKGKGYFRIEVGPVEGGTVGDLTYFENSSFIRFQKPVEEWGYIDRAAVYPERSGSVALPSYVGSVFPALSPQANDRVVIPPYGLRMLSDGTLTMSGYLSQGEAFRIDRVPIYTIVSERIHIA